MESKNQEGYGTPSITIRRNVVMVGPSGSGKSEVINKISQSEQTEARLDINHVTTDEESEFYEERQ